MKRPALLLLAALAPGPLWVQTATPPELSEYAVLATVRADSELVLRWRWPGLVAPPQPLIAGSWVDAGQAAALLPVVLAPLVRPS